MTTRRPLFSKMKIEHEQSEPADFLGMARSVVLAKRELAKALEAQAASETQIKGLIASGVAEGNSALKKQRREKARAVYHGKVALHQARHEFLDRLGILEKRLNRKNLNLDALIKHCAKIGFQHYAHMTRERREIFRKRMDALESADFYGKTGVDGIQVFHDLRTGIHIALHDFTVSGRSGLFEIRLGSCGNGEPYGVEWDFRIGEHTMWNNQYTTPRFSVLKKFVTCGVSEDILRPYNMVERSSFYDELLGFHDERRRPGSYLSAGERVLPTPEHFIKTLEVVAKYVKVCGDLGKVLPICPEFETTGNKVWRGGRKIWLGELEPGLRHLPAQNPRDDLAVAVSAGLGLQLVRLKKADNSQANMVIPEFADPKDYGAIEYAKFAPFYRAAK